MIAEAVLSFLPLHDSYELRNPNSPVSALLGMRVTNVLSIFHGKIIKILI